MVDIRIPMCDAVTESRGSAELIGCPRFDESPRGENVERRSRVLRWSEPFVRDPVGGEIDAFLDGQEQIERREIPTCAVPRKLLGVP